MPSGIKAKEKAYSSNHLNGHLICAIDIETTGLNPKKHDILQICILPLGPNFDPHPSMMPFLMVMCPQNPDNADEAAGRVSAVSLADALANGHDPFSAADRLKDWFESLKLPLKKKIVPLGANFGGIDKAFITEWLGGVASYEEFFRSDFRDVTQTAHFINDQAAACCEPIPFPKFNLTYLASCLQIKREFAHDALADCLTTAQVYKRMLRFKDFHEMYRVAGSDIEIQYRGDMTIVRHESKQIILTQENPNTVFRVLPKDKIL